MPYTFKSLRDNKDTAADRETLNCRLREVIEALDRRVSHPERADEIRIASEAAALKQNALNQIAELHLT